MPKEPIRSLRFSCPLRKQLGLGVMSEADKELVAEITGGDVTAIGNVMVLLDGMLTDSRAKTIETLKRRGNFSLPDDLPEGQAL